MKYIRTKDRIWLSEMIGYDESGHAYSKITGFYQDFTKKDIIKQADTIEKLIDGFIIGETLKIYNKSNFNFESKMVNLGHKDYVKFENLKSIYGVIMTFENDIPRIITVARMNEKGELELL